MEINPTSAERLWERLCVRESSVSTELEHIRNDKDALLVLMAMGSNQTAVAGRLGLSPQEVQRRVARWRRKADGNPEPHMTPVLEGLRIMDEKESLEYDGDDASVTAEIWPTRNPHIWTGEYAVWTDAGADGPYLLESDSHDVVVAAVEAVAHDKGAL